MHSYNTSTRVRSGTLVGNRLAMTQVGSIILSVDACSEHILNHPKFME